MNGTIIAKNPHKVNKIKVIMRNLLALSVKCQWLLFMLCCKELEKLIALG